MGVGVVTGSCNVVTGDVIVVGQTRRCNDMGV